MRFHAVKAFLVTGDHLMQWNFSLPVNPFFLLKSAESGTNEIKYSWFISHEDVNKDHRIHDIFFKGFNTSPP